MVQASPDFAISTVLTKVPSFAALFSLHFLVMRQIKSVMIPGLRPLPVGAVPRPPIMMHFPRRWIRLPIAGLTVRVPSLPFISTRIFPFLPTRNNPRRFLWLGYLPSFFCFSRHSSVFGCLPRHLRLVFPTTSNFWEALSFPRTLRWYFPLSRKRPIFLPAHALLLF